MKTQVIREAFPMTETGRVSYALAVLAGELNSIRYESDEDEAAMEWASQLTDCIDGLLTETMTPDQASESLGIKL